jgi:MoxR-like ATPase
MTNMSKSNTFTVSSSQHSFIVAVRPHLASCGITIPRITRMPSGAIRENCVLFSPLRQAAQKAGYSAVPLWCMTKDRKRNRGVYAIPELFADDSAFTIVEVKRGRKAGSTNASKLTKSAPAHGPRSTQAVVAARGRRAPFLNPTENVVSVSNTAIESCSAISQTNDLTTASLARTVTNGESDSFIPAVDPNYVPWGYHSEIKDILKRGIFAPVFITGLSGNGKTTMVEQVCAQLKRECVRVNFTAQTDEDELIGGFRLINGETKFVPGPVLVAMERGAVLLLDEIDLGCHLIMCLQSVLEGKGKYIPKIGKYVRPAPGFTVFATANTKGKGDSEGRFVGTNMMNEAFLERFDFTYEQDYASNTVEKKILTKYAESLGVNDDAFIENLISWGDIIRKSFKQQVVTEIITTRRLLHIIKAFSIFGDKMKSVERCVARFDDTTKEAFVQMYTKVDADAVLAPRSTDDPAAANSTQTDAHALSGL